MDFNNKVIFTWGNFTLTVAEVITLALLFTFTILLNKLLRYLVMKYGRKNMLDIGRLNSLVLLISYFVWIAAIFFAFRQSGMHLAYLVGGSAAVLVGLGLGLQEIFKDIVAGTVGDN